MMRPGARDGRPPFDLRVAGWFESVAMVLLVALVVALFYSVVAREVLRWSVAWTEEVAAGLLAWTVMLGAAGAWARRRHIVIDLFLRTLPIRARVVLSIVIELASMTLFAVIAWGSRQMMEASANNTTTALGISYTWLYLALLIGTCAMLCFSVLHLFRLLTDGRNVVQQATTESEWTTS